MKHLVLIVCFFLFFSCNKKTLQLPEASNCAITKVNDLSVAYIFYDRKMPDNVELNRKNLIISTNWIVNVDKRLSLEQAIPQIEILQTKRRKASMHKNEKARDFFACNDTAIKNLGFIEFTGVFYHHSTADEYMAKAPEIGNTVKVLVTVESLENIKISTQKDTLESIQTNSFELSHQLNALSNSIELKKELVLSFDKKLSFQDYINIKSQLAAVNDFNILLSPQEFIY